MNVVVLLIGSGPAFCSAQDDRYYVGASFGHVEFYDACQANSANCSSSDVGWKVYAGRRMSERVAIEGHFADLGATSSRTQISTGFGGTSRPVGARYRGAGAAIVGKATLGETRFAVIGKLGVQYLSAGSSSGTTSEADSGIEGVPGAGLEFRLTRGFALRTEAEWFPRVHAYMVSPGVKYGF